MSRHFVEELTRRQGATVEGSEAIPRKPDDLVETDLGNPQTQEKILHPDPVIMKLSYGEQILHQPSIEMRRYISGFAKKVMGEILEERPHLIQEDRIYLVPQFLAAKLCMDRNVQTILYLTISRLFDKPGRVSDQQAAEFADEMRKKCNDDDLTVLFGQLCAIVGMEKVAASANGRPTKAPVRKKTTRRKSPRSRS